ncbi:MULTISPECIES: baseplate J/gp47 family protein [Caproicibacterium]|uniref:Baseplate J/gp47 family protein n=1 Tax=Caproicibacterium argilliputei TaxID=3030016 RepID=A0AA97DDG9_9FIRM|nr:baseplate J/gp47 family protein [Caproicibacterium argilliputei]WOC33488.1 baseplate J/gp47 family protein [Caproicibacterium argilliputei]
MSDFTAPSFLTEDQDTIMERMRERFPADIDTSAGGFVWDLLRPTAVEESRFMNFDLVNALQIVFPQFASEQWLDYHAENRGIERKAAQPSTGKVTITGKPGTVVAAGSLFSTTSVGDSLSVDFAVTQDVTIPETGTAEAAVKCTQTGLSGNVQAGTVVLKDSSLSGVTAVTNEAAFTGGTEIEDDESLRARILYIDRTQGLSYVGSVSDYKRWALTVPGTGSATIISAQDDTGLVKIVLTDSNGAPATEELCTSVYNYIMHPDDPASRLAPINANISVVPPEEVQVTIAATVELESGNLDTVKEHFESVLLPYFGEVPNDGEIRYTKIASLLSDTPGVHDFKSLSINGKAENIPVTAMATPVLKEIDFDGGDV